MKCPACNGKGFCVNPNIDDRGLTSEDFICEDPDFIRDYLDGMFDQECKACFGKGTITETQYDALVQAADDRKLAALENGDYDAYSGAGDYRHGYY